MKVIDSSALVKFFSKEPGWENVINILLQKDIIVTLDLTVKEVGNALWKKVLKGEAREEDVIKIVESLIETFPLENELTYVSEALRIAIKNKITVYDALFIAQAKYYNAELVTSDKKQKEIAIKEGVKVIEV